MMHQEVKNVLRGAMMQIHAQYDAATTAMVPFYEAMQDHAKSFDLTDEGSRSRYYGVMTIEIDRFMTDRMEEISEICENFIASHNELMGIREEYPHGAMAPIHIAQRVFELNGAVVPLRNTLIREMLIEQIFSALIAKTPIPQRIREGKDILGD